MNPRRVLFLMLCLLACLLLTGPALAQDEVEKEPDSPLVQRTKEHLRTFDAGRNREENEVWYARTMALADSLEAEEEWSMISYCLARAGILDYYRNDLDTSLAVIERGLAAARKSGKDKRIAALLNTRANVVSAQGDNESALTAYFEILDLRRKIGDVRGEGVTWGGIAYAQRALFQFPESVESLRECIRLSREAGNRHGMATSYISLAPRLESYVRFEEARAIADSAIAIAREVDRPEFVGVALNMRGDMHHRHGRHEEALADFDAAIRILTEAGADRFLSAPVINRSDLLVSMGRLDEAIAETERARSVSGEFADPAGPLIASTARGRIHLRAEEFEDAERILREAIAGFQAFGDTLDDPVARAQAGEAAGAPTYLSFVYSRQGKTAEAWRTVEANLAGVLRGEIGGDSRVSLPEFQEALAARNAAALFYGLATVEGMPVFLITADGIETWEIDIRQGVRTAHAEVLDMMASGRGGEKLGSLLAELGAAILPKTIPEGVHRLVIVPGGFASLPFEALTHGGADLGDGFALSYSPSATTFVRLENRAISQGGFLALADPVPGELPVNDRWAERLRGANSVPLPEARAEVQTISPDGAVTFYGHDATPAAFKAEAGNASIVHLATHAIVDPAHPGNSALVLAGPDDGMPFLFAHEIDDMEFDADLVCLSSCGSAGGYQVPGEGAFGLTRSFLVAGARTVVASWWDVEDAAGRRFMELFYAGLGEGLERDVAAQRARLAMADEGYDRRDRMAFAVVGAVSGSLAETLQSGGRLADRWYYVLFLGPLFYFAFRRLAYR